MADFPRIGIRSSGGGEKNQSLTGISRETLHAPHAAITISVLSCKENDILLVFSGTFCMLK